MKVNTQCVLKYLKHDYKSMITPIVIIGEMCFAALLAIVVLYDISVIVEIIFSHLSIILLPSAYTLLNVIAAIIVIVVTFGVAIFGNKEWFEYKPWKEGYGWGSNDFETKGSGIVFVPIFGLGLSIYLPYWIVYLLLQNWESPLLSTIIFIILILIGTPIGCAIAKCKEE